MVLIFGLGTFPMATSGAAKISQPVVATGSVTCTPLSGSIAYEPAMKKRGTGTRSASKKVSPTSATFSARAHRYSEHDVGVIIPRPGGTPHVTGSFAGSNNGANSGALVYVNQTLSPFEQTCESSHALTS